VEITIIVVPNAKGNPPGKLADVEVHFVNGPLAGLKLVGFAVWERRGGSGRTVTFPARQYSINGERRSYAVLRAVPGGSEQGLRDRILDAFAQGEAAPADASGF
jgi:hypothetical protein